MKQRTGINNSNEFVMKTKHVKVLSPNKNMKCGFIFLFFVFSLSPSGLLAQKVNLFKSKL